MSVVQDNVAKDLIEATEGFDALFANDLAGARKIFSANSESSFHQLGAGVCAFLEAALGMEAVLVAEAAECLTRSESSAKTQLKVAKILKSTTRFPVGTEWELMHSDATILHGITHALGESYMGYMQCIYALNNAHSKFTKLYKTVYPNGLDGYETPSTSATSSRAPSVYSETSTVKTPKASSRGFLSRISNLSLSEPAVTPVISTPDGPIEELIMSGTAFGYGMFNLVFSLLPAGVRGVVGFLGFKHDRKLALRALAVSAARNDVHSVFAGLTLMTYYGVVLLLAGYQSDENHILKQYRAIVDKIEKKYPTGSLWILNRAKILRMSYDPYAAIDVLRHGLRPDRPHTFAQADGLLIFELAWTLLSTRQYKEAADTFIKITEVNSWSHATYYFIAAGCHVCLQDYTTAQKLLDRIPSMIDKKKIGGKDLPTEVFIKKKLQFYREKQKRRTGSEDNFSQVIKISPAHELALFWNTHARITKEVAQGYITEFASFSPPSTISSPFITEPVSTESPADLDTSDELAIRSLLLGALHRTAGEYEVSRAFLVDAHKRHSDVKVSTWVGGMALYEQAVLDLNETSFRIGSDVLLDSSKKATWLKTIKGANEKLDQALSLSGQSVDLSSRLDMRIAMLRDEISLKKESIEVV